MTGQVVVRRNLDCHFQFKRLHIPCGKNVRDWDSTPYSLLEGIICSLSQPARMSEFRDKLGTGALLWPVSNTTPVPPVQIRSRSKRTSC